MGIGMLEFLCFSVFLGLFTYGQTSKYHLQATSKFSKFIAKILATADATPNIKLVYLLGWGKISMLQCCNALERGKNISCAC